MNDIPWIQTPRVTSLAMITFTTAMLSEAYLKTDSDMFLAAAMSISLFPLQRLPVVLAD